MAKVIQGSGDSTKPLIIDDVSDDGASLDDDQLDEYLEMIDELGSFPDKVIINTLSMVAEDFAESQRTASKIYGCIRSKLKSVSSDRKLPLVYVIDSILKNVKGSFISLIEEDAKIWLPNVYNALPDDRQREKLKKVWITWKGFQIFQESCWKEMGRCFGDESDDKDKSNKEGASPSGSGSSSSKVSRAKDGSLLLSAPLRKEMQTILDELQNDITNELDKVSLQRLADINSDLFNQILTTAKENINQSKERQAFMLRQQQGQKTNGVDDSLMSNDNPPYFTEIRSQEVLQRSLAWHKIDLNHTESTEEIMSSLKQIVRGNSSSECRYTQQEAIEMTYALAAASATASMLSNALKTLQNQEDNKENQSFSLFPTSNSNISSGPAIDKTLFTNDGIKKKNDTVIGVLYEVGLPFISSSDGRRFATQIELSNHLDALFKRSQIEKIMARTEERGWYTSDTLWTGEEKVDMSDKSSQVRGDHSEPVSSLDEEADPSSFTVPADESRDRCVICGINFKMFFDNDDGIYKYNNCREIKVLNDDVAAVEFEMMLVHVTCWRGLGSPVELTDDQTIQRS